MSDARTDSDQDAPSDPGAGGESGPDMDGPPAGTTDGSRFACSYCDRVFTREPWLALHRGLEHDARLDEAERAAYEAATDEEEEWLRLFRLKALAVLVVVYFGFIMAFALF